MAETNCFGTMEWHDLTVDDADRVRDFYQAVVGWTLAPVSMGEYNDYGMMLPGSNDAAGGICHRRGGNADIPSQWLIYIRVADLEASLAICRDKGGKLISGPKHMGEDMRYCVIQDPADAICALFWKR